MNGVSGELFGEILGYSYSANITFNTKYGIQWFQNTGNSIPVANIANFAQNFGLWFSQTYTGPYAPLVTNLVGAAALATDSDFILARKMEIVVNDMWNNPGEWPVIGPVLMPYASYITPITSQFTWLNLTAQQMNNDGLVGVYGTNGQLIRPNGSVLYSKLSSQYMNSLLYEYGFYQVRNYNGQTVHNFFPSQTRI